jgi:CRISPR-associated protein Csd2
MACRKLIVFKHASELGCAPSYELFDRIKVQKKADVVAPRSYQDYEVSVNTDALPDGVDCIRKL